MSSKDSGKHSGRKKNDKKSFLKGCNVITKYMVPKPPNERFNHHKKHVIGNFALGTQDITTEISSMKSTVSRAIFTTSVSVKNPRKKPKQSVDDVIVISDSDDEEVAQKPKTSSSVDKRGQISKSQNPICEPSSGIIPTTQRSKVIAPNVKKSAVWLTPLLEINEASPKGSTVTPKLIEPTTLSNSATKTMAQHTASKSRNEPKLRLNGPSSKSMKTGFADRIVMGSLVLKSSPIKPSTTQLSKPGAQSVKTGKQTTKVIKDIASSDVSKSKDNEAPVKAHISNLSKDQQTISQTLDSQKKKPKYQSPSPKKIMEKHLKMLGKTVTPQKTLSTSTSLPFTPIKDRIGIAYAHRGNSPSLYGKVLSNAPARSVTSLCSSTAKNNDEFLKRVEKLIKSEEKDDLGRNDSSHNKDEKHLQPVRLFGNNKNIPSCNPSDSSRNSRQDSSSSASSQSNDNLDSNHPIQDSGHNKKHSYFRRKDKNRKDKNHNILITSVNDSPEQNQAKVEKNLSSESHTATSQNQTVVKGENLHTFPGHKEGNSLSQGQRSQQDNVSSSQGQFLTYGQMPVANDRTSSLGQSSNSEVQKLSSSLQGQKTLSQGQIPIGALKKDLIQSSFLVARTKVKRTKSNSSSELRSSQGGSVKSNKSRSSTKSTTSARKDIGDKLIDDFVNESNTKIFASPPNRTPTKVFTDVSNNVPLDKSPSKSSQKKLPLDENFERIVSRRQKSSSRSPASSKSRHSRQNITRSSDSEASDFSDGYKLSVSSRENSNELSFSTKQYHENSESSFQQTSKSSTTQLPFLTSVNSTSPLDSDSKTSVLTNQILSKSHADPTPPSTQISCQSDHRSISLSQSKASTETNFTKYVELSKNGTSTGDDKCDPNRPTKSPKDQNNSSYLSEDLFGVSSECNSTTKSDLSHADTIPSSVDPPPPKELPHLVNQSHIIVSNIRKRLRGTPDVLPSSKRLRTHLDFENDDSKMMSLIDSVLRDAKKKSRERRLGECSPLSRRALFTSPASSHVTHRTMLREGPDHPLTKMLRVRTGNNETVTPNKTRSDIKSPSDTNMRTPPGQTGYDANVAGSEIRTPSNIHTPTSLYQAGYYVRTTSNHTGSDIRTPSIGGNTIMDDKSGNYTRMSSIETRKDSKDTSPSQTETREQQNRSEKNTEASEHVKNKPCEQTQQTSAQQNVEMVANEVTTSPKIRFPARNREETQITGRNDIDMGLSLTLATDKTNEAISVSVADPDSQKTTKDSIVRRKLPKSGEDIVLISDTERSPSRAQSPIPSKTTDKRQLRQALHEQGLFPKNPATPELKRFIFPQALKIASILDKRSDKQVKGQSMGSKVEATNPQKGEIQEIGSTLKASTKAQHLITVAVPVKSVTKITDDVIDLVADDVITERNSGVIDLTQSDVEDDVTVVSTSQRQVRLDNHGKDVATRDIHKKSTLEDCEMSTPDVCEKLTSDVCETIRETDDDLYETATDNTPDRVVVSTCINARTKEQWGLLCDLCGEIHEFEPPTDEDVYITGDENITPLDFQKTKVIDLSEESNNETDTNSNYESNQVQPVSSKLSSSQSPTLLLSEQSTNIELSVKPVTVSGSLPMPDKMPESSSVADNSLQSNSNLVVTVESSLKRGTASELSSNLESISEPNEDSNQINNADAHESQNVYDTTILPPRKNVILETENSENVVAIITDKGLDATLQDSQANAVSSVLNDLISATERNENAEMISFPENHEAETQELVEKSTDVSENCIESHESFRESGKFAESNENIVIESPEDLIKQVTDALEKALGQVENEATESDSVPNNHATKDSRDSCAVGPPMVSSLDEIISYKPVEIAPSEVLEGIEKTSSKFDVATQVKSNRLVPDVSEAAVPSAGGNATHGTDGDSDAITKEAETFDEGLERHDIDIERHDSEATSNVMESPRKTFALVTEALEKALSQVNTEIEKTSSWHEVGATSAGDACQPHDSNAISPNTEIGEVNSKTPHDTSATNETLAASKHAADATTPPHNFDSYHNDSEYITDVFTPELYLQSPNLPQESSKEVIQSSKSNSDLTEKPYSNGTPEKSLQGSKSTDTSDFSQTSMFDISQFFDDDTSSNVTHDELFHHADSEMNDDLPEFMREDDISAFRQEQNKKDIEAGLLDELPELTETPRKRRKILPESPPSDTIEKTEKRMSQLLTYTLLGKSTESIQPIPGRFNQSIQLRAESPGRYNQSFQMRVEPPGRFNQSLQIRQDSPSNFNQSMHKGLESPIRFNQFLPMRAESPNDSFDGSQLIRDLDELSRAEPRSPRNPRKRIRSSESARTLRSQPSYTAILNDTAFSRSYKTHGASLKKLVREKKKDHEVDKMEKILLSDLKKGGFRETLERAERGDEGSNHTDCDEDTQRAINLMKKDWGILPRLSSCSKIFKSTRLEHCHHSMELQRFFTSKSLQSLSAQKRKVVMSIKASTLRLHMKFLSYLLNEADTRMQTYTWLVEVMRYHPNTDMVQCTIQSNLREKNFNQSPFNYSSLKTVLTSAGIEPKVFKSNKINDKVIKEESVDPTICENCLKRRRRKLPRNLMGIVKVLSTAIHVHPLTLTQPQKLDFATFLLLLMQDEKLIHWVGDIKDMLVVLLDGIRDWNSAKFVICRRLLEICPQLPVIAEILERLRFHNDRTHDLSRIISFAVLRIHVFGEESRSVAMENYAQLEALVDIVDHFNPDNIELLLLPDESSEPMGSQKRSYYYLSLLLPLLNICIGDECEDRSVMAILERICTILRTMNKRIRDNGAIYRSQVKYELSLFTKNLRALIQKAPKENKTSIFKYLRSAPVREEVINNSMEQSSDSDVDLDVSYNEADDEVKGQSLKFKKFDDDIAEVLKSKIIGMAGKR